MGGVLAHGVARVRPAYLDVRLRLLRRARTRARRRIGRAIGARPRVEGGRRQAAVLPAVAVPPGVAVPPVIAVPPLIAAVLRGRADRAICVLPASRRLALWWRLLLALLVARALAEVAVARVAAHGPAPLGQPTVLLAPPVTHELGLQARAVLARQVRLLLRRLRRHVRLRRRLRRRVVLLRCRRLCVGDRLRLRKRRRRLLLGRLDLLCRACSAAFCSATRSSCFAFASSCAFALAASASLSAC